MQLAVHIHSSHSCLQIPQRPQVSRCCKELLNGLLQREPDKRISYDEFFSHPFIDLEHMPSSESLSKAVRFFPNDELIVHEVVVYFMAGVFS